MVVPQAEEQQLVRAAAGLEAALHTSTPLRFSLGKPSRYSLVQVAQTQVDLQTAITARILPLILAALGLHMARAANR